MRKIVVLSMITLDGVMQAPGGREEDTSGRFKYGGWTAPYFDEMYDKVVQQELQQPSDYLLGRTTFEIWANYWPQHGDFWPGINEGAKYVFSKNMKKKDPLITGWKNSALLKSLGEIKKLKNTEGNNIQVWGSSELIQLLLKNDLVDELRLKIHPLTLGKGKKLFDNGGIPAAFTLIDSAVTTKGVIIAHYRRAGEVITGNVGAEKNEKKDNMAKVIAALNMTLDGYCDHTAMIADEEIHDHYTELLRNSGTLLYGRITYQLMENFWPALVKHPSGQKSLDEFAAAIDKIPKIVFSHTLQMDESTDMKWKTARVARRSIEDEIAALRLEVGRDILVGSPSLIAQCTALNLIDQYQLGIQPTIEGKGLPLFKNVTDRVNLQLLKTKTFSAGVVMFYYDRKK